MKKIHDKFSFWCKIILHKIITEKRFVMNLLNNSTKFEKDLRDVLENWNKKILPYPPGNLNKLARKTGVIQRKRGINSAAELLEHFSMEK